MCNGAWFPRIGLFAFTFCDDDRPDGIAENVDGGAAHIEEAVGDPNHPDRFNRQPDCGENDGNRNEAGGGDSGDPDAGGEREDHHE